MKRKHITRGDICEDLCEICPTEILSPTSAMECTVYVKTRIYLVAQTKKGQDIWKIRNKLCVFEKEQTFGRRRSWAMLGKLRAPKIRKVRKFSIK